MDVNGQLHTTTVLPLGKSSPLPHWIGVCVSPTAGLDSANRCLYASQTPLCILVSILTEISQLLHQNNNIFYTHLSQLHKVSRRSLSSSSPSRNNFSASLLASSSFPLFPSGLWFMDRHEWRRDLRGHRRLIGEPTNSPWPPWLARPNRFSVDLLAKIWRTSTGLRIRGELHGEH